MPETEKSDKKWSKQATEKLFAVLNRADEIGGEIRDYLQEKVATDARYVATRKRIAKLLGRDYQSRDDVKQAAQVREAKAAAVAATPTTTAKPKQTGFGDPGVKAQIFGKKSCPWTGRAITLLERHKVDFDYIDLEEPEHEAKLVPLQNETKQHTVPFVYLRGHFVGGFNALSEVERLGQLEVAMMSAEERAKAPAHQRNVEITPRPNTDEVAPAEQNPAE
ncbi:MAG TPA: glutaredoxin [Kofleriaceae bacterium]|nr:glutaredoxin [Kofleriaceae bacterium]